MDDTNSNNIGNIQPVVSQDGNPGIKATTSPFVTTFYFDDFYDDKAVKAFSKSVEKLIRTSREYNDYIGLLRTNILALNKDNVLSNITTADVDLEFHHYPFTLYDIVQICMIQNMVNNVKFTSYSIAKEVMNLHYQNLVGLVPLTKTMHELAQSGDLFISSKQIFGNYKTFMTMYDKAISQDMKLKISKMEENTINNYPTDYKGILQ
jgi:hypothetical protein